MAHGFDYYHPSAASLYRVSLTDPKTRSVSAVVLIVAANPATAMALAGVLYKDLHPSDAAKVSNVDMIDGRSTAEITVGNKVT